MYNNAQTFCICWLHLCVSFFKVANEIQTLLYGRLVVLCPLGRHVVNCKQKKPPVTPPHDPCMCGQSCPITKHVKGPTSISFMNFADLALVIYRCSLVYAIYILHTFIRLSFAINVLVSVSDLNLSNANTRHTISFAAIFLFLTIYL